MWARQFGGSGSDRGFGITVDASGNVYTIGDFRGTADFDPDAGIANTLTSAGTTDVFVSKLNSSGNFVWAKRFGDTLTDAGYGVAVDASGNVYTTGGFSSTVDFDPGDGTSNLVSAGSSDVFVSKLDSSGNFVWAKRFGGTLSDVANDLAIDGSGNVHTTGYFNGTVDFDPGDGTSNLVSAGTTDVFVSKLDSSGNFVWAKRFGGTSSDEAYGIDLDSSGNVYTTGFFYLTADFDPGSGTSNLTSVGSDDGFVSKLTSSGDFVWARQIGGSSGGYPEEIEVDSSGIVHITGYFQGTVDFDPGADTSNLTSAGSLDIFVSKLTSAGDYAWAVRFGGTSSDWGRSIALDSSSNVYTAGYFNSTVDFDPGAGTCNKTSAGLHDVFVSKLNSAGAGSS